METIFMNTENSKTSQPHRFKQALVDKVNLKDPSKNMVLHMGNIKSTYNNNKLKISAPTWNNVFDLPDGSYSISDIQDYFEYIIKKQTIANNPPVQIFVNKIKNRIVFKIKTD